MSHYDDLPRRPKSHETESKAEAAFTSFLADLRECHLQKIDRKDYGTDCEVEVVDQEMATNARLHVQLKGTQQPTNADGSISVAIDRANLNYLLMQPFSSFVCYHVPTDTLWLRTSESVLRGYEHSGRSWSDQTSLTVKFTEQLTPERFRKLTDAARAAASSSRDRRIAHSTAAAEDVPALLRQPATDLHVGDDEARALAVLQHLYESGDDMTISASFAKFEAVFGPDHEAMGQCYMAEINLGMARLPVQEDRVAAAISHFRARIGTGRYLDASLHYTIGNALAALGKDDEAVVEYEAALAGLGRDTDRELAAQCHKNLGSSLEKLGDEEEAVRHYRLALKLSPNLAEAHHALASYHHRKGEYREALDHFDKAVFLNDRLGKQASVAGWRLNALFQLGEGKSAFREINVLLRDADVHPWIWPWCARQVAIFGRTASENAQLSLSFWDHFLATHPDHSQGKREQLLARLYLRNSGADPGSSFTEIKAQLETHGEGIETDALAFLWDRLGHWAQDEEDWSEAEICFRKAYDLAGGHYGYCLGTALNFLGRCEESLPILREQAERLQPDAMSWFQVAAALEKLGQDTESVEAYRRAIALDPNYDLAWFNLGGVFWNSGDRENARRIWKEAIGLFPDHELSAKLRTELPFLLD